MESMDLQGMLLPWIYAPLLSIAAGILRSFWIRAPGAVHRLRRLPHCMRAISRNTSPATGPPRPSTARVTALLLLGAATLAGCGGDGDSDPVGSFVDPSGEYSVSISQTTDTCTNQTGTINWGGATLDLQGSTLVIDLPEAPGSTTCIRTSVPYLMNSVQVSAERPTVVGNCNILDSLTLSLEFTTGGFSGSYSIRRSGVSGDCSMLTLPCEARGTITGDPGLGSPACP